MAKKILMISSTWDTNYIRTLLHGMTEKLKTEDAQLFVFNAYDEALESEYHLMERAIYSLPDVNQFDGVLLAVNSAGNQSAVHELANYYKNQGTVVLSMELKMDGIPSIGTDNYQAEYDLVSHMIEVHGCRTLNYLGGPEEHLENSVRYQAFSDCMRDHDLPVEKERVAHFSFRISDGIKAYEAFKEKGIQLPDAVVCANDHMALGYCTAAGKDGYTAPADFKITGFDNIKESQEYSPSVTSISRNWDVLGYSSIEQLLDMIDNTSAYNAKKYFKGHTLVINESCGCIQERNYQNDLIDSFHQKLISRDMQTLDRLNRKLFGGSVDFSDLSQKLRICQENTGIRHIALCINKSAFSKTVSVQTEYDKEFMVYTDQTSFLQNRDQGLVPDGWCDDSKIFFFSPLHFGSINFGYCVIPFYDNWKPELDHRALMESICLGLEGIRQHEYLRQANERLNDLYLKDSLTGMYNRYGYENVAEALFARLNGKVYAVYLDLDNLKILNDTYGHNTGDVAILGIAHAIEEVFYEKSIPIRMGGDEFLVIGECDGEDNLLKKIALLHKSLAEFSTEQNLPIPLSVSVGHICNAQRNLSLAQMIRIADQNMYEQKKRKKQA